MLTATTGSVIDLTLAYDQSISGYQSRPARRLETDGWNADYLEIYSHAGTHMDAPLHFGLETTIDQYDPNSLMGRAWVLSLSSVQPKQLIGVSDLGVLAEKIQAGDSLIIRTNWSQYLGQEKYRHELPRISEELAHWLGNRKINMLGVEPPSVADVNNLAEVTLIHQILLGAKIKIVEGLCNLDQIRSDLVWMIALPLKIRGGDGAPCRVLALEMPT
ncbi:MAG: cyclase family protein [Bacteroidota bacterium]